MPAKRSMTVGLDDLLEPWSDPGRTAVVIDGTRISYAALAARITATAAGLAVAGVGDGDRVAFCGLNRVELFEALFACARLGAILLPLNNRLTATELAWQITDADPALLLTTDGFVDLVTDAAGGRPVRDLDADPFVPAHSADPPADSAPAHAAGPPADQAPAAQPAGMPPSTSVGAGGAPGAGPPTGAGGGDADVLMVYTSGTTGHPKGAVLQQSALRATIDNSISWLGLTADDRVLAVLPTFHVGGINIQVLPALAAGATLILHRRFDPAEALAAISEHRPTHTVFVPAMLTAVAAHPNFPRTDLSCFTAVATGSSVVPAAAMDPWFERGVTVAQVYGATETGPTAVVLPPADAAARPTSAGLPARHNDVRVVDPDTGLDCATNADGEVWLRGPNLFDRYWRNPAATAAAFVDGWYRTGDIGRLDSDGYLWIADRRDDLIISGGENVYPAEVEAVLADHPDVVEVTVVGQPDERWGQVPVAVVVAAAGSTPTVADLQRWCDGRLARFKQPRRLVLVGSLPRTSLGKVRKHEVRRDLGLT